MPADHHPACIRAHEHTANPPDPCPLRHHQITGQPPIHMHPLGNGGIQRSGDRILDHAAGWGQVAHLIIRLSPGRVRANNRQRDKFRPTDAGRINRQHILCRCQFQQLPDRTIIQLGRPDHLFSPQIQRLHIAGLISIGHRDHFGRRGNERGHRPGHVNLDNTNRTLLTDHTGLRRNAAGMQPRHTTAQGRMPRKRHLATGGKDAYGIIGPGFSGRCQKGGFRQIGPGRKCLHLVIGQTIGIDNHSQPVPLGGNGAEHITLDKSPRRQHQSDRSHPSPRCRNNRSDSWPDIAGDNPRQNRTLAHRQSRS